MMKKCDGKIVTDGRTDALDPLEPTMIINDSLVIHRQIEQQEIYILKAFLFYIDIV